MSRPDHRLAGIVQWTLVAIGVALIGWVGFVRLERAWFHAAEVRTLESTAAPDAVIPEEGPAPPVTDAGEAAARAAFAGLLEIPRIGLSAAFAEGDDDGTLRKAIGHLPDTPLPWHIGNAAFAGHRDQQFRPLKGIRAGDEIRLVTPRGTFLYVVSRTFVVEPTDVWVLAPSGGHELTLITCYPFSYIGHAPHRFVVKATAREGQVWNHAIEPKRFTEVSALR